QAEDGIRDRNVTGVQTCALPISPLLRPPKLLALARNYQDHITEGGGQPVDKQRIVPKLFLKPSSAIIGPDAPLCLPSISSTTDRSEERRVGKESEPRRRGDLSRK